MDQENASKPGLANPDEEMWRNRYQAFVRLYKGREDVIAERRGGEYVAVPGGGLTFERFLDHVRMNKTFALYNKDDAGRVSFGLFDVDIFPRDQGWEKLLLAMDAKKKETARIMQTLVEMGLKRRNLLIEFPTVGFHLLLFFDRPVPADALKNVMRFVLKRSDLEQVPFYPHKLDAPWGDRVQLPLRINLNTSRRSNFVSDLESFDPEHYAAPGAEPDAEPDFSVLDQVVPIPSEWVGAMMAQYQLA
jgi:hypothetical protein